MSKTVSLEKSSRTTLPVLVEGESIAEVTYNPNNPLLIKGISKLTSLLSGGFPCEDELKILEDTDRDETGDIDRVVERAKRMSVPLAKIASLLDDLVDASDAVLGRGVTETIFAHDDADMTLLKGVIQEIVEDIAASRKDKTSKYKA